MIYPDAGFKEWVQDGELVESLLGALSDISPALCEGSGSWDALRDAGVEDELEIEYTRLFEAGPKGPLCPLYGGLYGGIRMKVMEEAARFYNHFGLTLSGTPQELSDHLTTELEFMHYLAYREAEAQREGVDAGPYRRGQRDFIERHPGSWIPTLCIRLDEVEAAPFYAATLHGLRALLEWDSERLQREEPRSS